MLTLTDIRAHVAHQLAANPAAYTRGGGFVADFDARALYIDAINALDVNRGARRPQIAAGLAAIRQQVAAIVGAVVAKFNANAARREAAHV